MWSIKRLGNGAAATEYSCIFSRVEEQGPFAAQSQLIETASGWYDARGSRRARRGALNVVLDGEIYARSGIEAIIASLAADIGRVDNLYRVWSESGEVQFARMRVLAVDIKRTWPRALVVPAKITFQGAGPWNGESWHLWYLDSGEYLDAGLTLDGYGWTSLAASTIYSFTAPGNIRQNNVIMKIKPTATAMTKFTLVCAAVGIDLEYSGTVAAGQVLEIDSESMTVTNNGADDYDNLSLQSGHSLERFLAVDAGSNQFTFTATGPTDFELHMTFYGAYA